VPRRAAHGSQKRISLRYAAGDAEAIDAAVVVSAEEWRPGGEMLRSDDGDSARRSAVLLAELMALLEGRPGKALDPPPPWMHWNPPGGGLWPPNGPIDRMDQTLVPDNIQECARRATSRLRHSALPHVLGDGDWEAQNIRWKDGRPWSVYDWDSLVSLPEAAIVGAASGAFASAKVPTLAPIGRSLGPPACGRPSITQEENIYFARSRLHLWRSWSKRKTASVSPEPDAGTEE
jgi:hypothetical protein